MAQRTWREQRGADGGCANRWDMLLDGEPVEGAYVLMKERGCYELHFPRMSVSTVPSLPAAMKALENAPLLASKGIKIGRPADPSSEAGFATVDEAAGRLGISRARVNAMVANGVVAAMRTEEGVMVSIASLMGVEDPAKAVARGRFANKFVQYFPDCEEEDFLLAEVDADDEDELSSAQAFVDCVRDDENHPGGARLLSYRAAMRLKHSDHRLELEGVPGIPRMRQVPVEQLLCYDEQEESGAQEEPADNPARNGEGAFGAFGMESEDAAGFLVGEAVA